MSSLGRLEFELEAALIFSAVGSVRRHARPGRRAPQPDAAVQKVAGVPFSADPPCHEAHG